MQNYSKNIVYKKKTGKSVKKMLLLSPEFEDLIFKRYRICPEKEKNILF